MSTIETYGMEDLANEVFRQAEAAADYVQSTERIRVEIDPDGRPRLQVLDNDGSVIPELDGGLLMTEHAHSQLATAFEIPKVYYDRLREHHKELWTVSVNYLFDAEPKRRLVRVLDDRVRAFLSDGYRRRDNWDLVKAIYPTLAEMPDVRFTNLRLTETNMYIRASLPRIRAEVRVGDWVESGVVVKNSEVGAGTTAVYPYLFRLDCLNGMVSEHFGEAARHVGRRIDETDSARLIYSEETRRLDDQAWLAKVGDVVRACYNEAKFNEIVMQCRELAQIRMDVPPSQVCERLRKAHDVSVAEAEAIEKAIVEDGDLSGWGLLNAITATARDTASGDRAYELEALGGKLVADPRAVLTLVA
jgi:hypothetical protein